MSMEANEKITRREFLIEAGALIWAGAAVGSAIEGAIRSKGYEQEINESFPNLDERSRRQLIVSMAKQKGEEWKDTLELAIIFGFVSSFFIVLLRTPRIMMSR